MNGTNTTSTSTTRERLGRKKHMEHHNRSSRHRPRAGEQQHQQQEQERRRLDVLHNLQTPCCRLIQEAAYDIFPPSLCLVTTTTTKNNGQSSSSSSSSPSSGSLLGKLIQEHYLQEFQQQQQNSSLQRSPNHGSTTSTTATNKKKKKRKRKKKAAAAVAASGEGTTETGTSSTSTPTTTIAPEVGEEATTTTTTTEMEATADEAQPVHDGQQAPDENASSSSSAPPLHATTTPSSSPSLLQTTSMTATTASNTTANTTTTTTIGTAAMTPVPSSMTTSSSSDDVLQHYLQRASSLRHTTMSSSSSLSSPGLPPNRTLDAFLQDVISKQQQQDGTNTCDNSHYVKIPIRHVHAAVDSISCLQCKRVAQSRYWQLLQAYNNNNGNGNTNSDTTNTSGNDDDDTATITIPLSPSYFVTPSDSIASSSAMYVSPLDINAIQQHEKEMDVERAFDYVAMEEGQSSSYVCVPPNGGDDVGARQDDDDDENRIVKLHFAGGGGGGHPPSSTSTTPTTATKAAVLECNHVLTREQIDVILKGIILTHGLPQEEDDGEEQQQQENGSGSSSNVSLVIDTVTRAEEDLKRDLCERVARSLSTMKAQIDDTLNTATLQIDIRTSDVFRVMDTELDETLHELISWVRAIFARYDSLSGGQTATTAQPLASMYDRIKDLFSCVVQAVTSILRGQLKHAALLLQVAQRPGSVPIMALDAKHRNSYRDLLIVKVEALKILRGELENRLLEKLLYRAVLTHMQLEGIPDCDVVGDSSVRDKNDDEFWRTCEDMTKTIFCSNVQELKKKQVKRTQEWMKAICTKHESFPSGSKPPTESLTLEYNSLMKNVTFLQDAVVGGEDESVREEAIPKFSNDVCLLFQNVLNQWLYRKGVANGESYCGHTTKTIVVPLKLKRFLRGQSEPHVWSDATCEGGGGRRRVTGIVAGLFYRWLQDRCNEWHAELTQNELLESMMDESVEKSATSKPAKNKKSRKKKDRKIALAQYVPSGDSTPRLKKSESADDGADKSVDADEGLDTSTKSTAKSTKKLEAKPVDAAIDVGGSRSIAKDDRGASTKSDEKNAGNPSVATLNTASDTADSNPPTKPIGRSTVNSNAPNRNEATDATSKEMDDSQVWTDLDSSDSMCTNGKSKEKKAADTKAIPAAVDKSESSDAALMTIVDDRIEAVATAEEDKSRGRSPTKKGSSTKEKKKKSKSPKSQPVTPDLKNSASKTNSAAVDSKTKKPKSSPRKRPAVSSDLPVDVGVVSTTGFQSAEGFLVQRLVAVLRDEAKSEQLS